MNSWEKSFLKTKSRWAKNAKEEVMFKGGLGSPGRVGGVCNCSGCQQIRANKLEIVEIENKLQSQISVIRESVAHSIKRLERECEETIQRLQKDAEEKIEQIKKKKED